MNKLLYPLAILLFASIPLSAQTVYCSCNLIGFPICSTTNRSPAEFARDFNNSCDAACQAQPGGVSNGRFPGSAEAGYSNVGCTMERSVLPVELTSFEATIKHRAVSLVWHTASEQSNEGFYVERSTDGVSFEEIIFIQGYGTTKQEQQYSYDDQELPSGYVYYYRLRQVDYDGQFAFSNIIVLTVAGSELNVSKLYPNPASNGLVNLNIVSPITGTQSVVVSDVFGRIVLERDLGLSQGLNTVSLDVSFLPRGNYVMMIAQGSEVVQRKFIVR